ncbi:MAG: bifunctional UDP-3-O-[3-hydroxymyristoyl] N-acetylglucosamine deacetylase/3-hydroxyacyl-ACP dehydratase [Bacteroidota bacterium]|nr:bifunctional UDP-3-O-[3-hydroxymyristoyl] N-acetylglucosamine deacetylase/3-hydroxyacyl-ACP dehydratase [Bacteroidota bacterium]
MIAHQRTINKSATIKGLGLHTGVETTLTFRPAPEDYGIRFKRVDLGGNPEIPALVDLVVDVSRGTTLSLGEAKVHTVEHILAAVVGLQIDNIIIELDNIEPPICDGSARPFVDALLEAGLHTQNAPKDYLIIDQPIQYKDEKKGVEIVALPTDDYRVTVLIDYHNPALGSQHTGLFNLEKEFVEEFSSARTFCFLKEVEVLHSQGLIKGGNLNNAIVIVDREMSDDEVKRVAHKLGIGDSVILGKTGALNNKLLRYKNEPARHKLLDLLGDLALIGAPIKAQILAGRPGHASNVEFAKLVRKMYLQKKLVKKFQHEKKEGVVFDINAIKKILPHRYPFLLIDKIVDFKLDESIVGIKNVTVNESFFEGHFPGQPVMPGVLIIEAMAQTGGILLLNGVENPGAKLVYFMSINNAKFRKPVLPGDQLVFEVKLINRRSKIAFVHGKAFVDGNLVAEAELSAAIVDRFDGGGSNNQKEKFEKPKEQYKIN